MVVQWIYVPVGLPTSPNAKKKGRNQNAERCSFYFISIPEAAMPCAVAFVCDMFSTDMPQKMIITSVVFRGFYIQFADNEKYFNLGNFISVNILEERDKNTVVLSKMGEVEVIEGLFLHTLQVFL